TTHWEDVDVLARRLAPAVLDRSGGSPGTTGPTESGQPTGHEGPVTGVRWVDDGEVVTAAGLSSGIAMALHLVDRFAGRDLAERTARQIDYDWRPGAAARPPPADPPTAG
ncbi:MAG TPA: hypothetical protein VFZ68_12460, partial [Acidimicrobiales bacterium]